MKINDNRPAPFGVKFLKIPYGSTFASDGEVYQRLNRNSHPLTKNAGGYAISKREGLAVRLSNEGGLHKFAHGKMVQSVTAELSIA